MDIKEITLVVPNATSVLGIFYIQEIGQNGCHYNCANSKVFMIPGIDGIDLITGQTYKINEENEWEAAESTLIMSDEKKRDIEQLQFDFDEEGAPSMEG